MFSSFKIWVLFKNGVRIAVRRLIKVLETNFLWQARKIEYFPKSGVRISLRRLIKVLEKIFCDKQEKLSTFQKWC